MFQKRILIYLFLFLSNSLFPVFSEERNSIDSLLRALNAAPPDTEKSNILFYLAHELVFNNPDTALIVQKQALELTLLNLSKKTLHPKEKEKFELSYINSYINIGYIHLSKGNNELALNCFLKSLHFLQNNLSEEMKIKFKSSFSNCYNNIGFVYDDIGDAARAIEYYHKSLEIDEALGDTIGIAIALNNIGTLLSTQNENEDAKKYFLRSLHLYETQNNKSGAANCLNNLGILQRKNHSYSEAISYYEKSLHIYKEINNADGIAQSLNNAGSVYLIMKEYEKAKSYFERSLEIYHSLNENRGVITSLNHLARVLLKMERVLEAKNIAEQNLISAKSSGSVAEIKYTTDILFKIYKKIEDYQSALETYELFIQMRDSISNEKTQKASIRQQTKYEFEKAQLIRKQNENEEKLFVAEQISRRNNLQYSIILIGLLLLFGGTLFLGFIKVSPTVATGLIFFTFLLFFEFILVLVDPHLESVTGGAPGIKLLFNSLIAGIIFPLHSYFEKGLKKRLIK